MGNSIGKKAAVFGILSLFFVTSMHCTIQQMPCLQAADAKTTGPSSVLSVNTNTSYYAVICACSRYKDPKNNIPKGFPSSEKKLRVVYDALLERQNWHEENMILLLNENATRQNILDALDLMSTRVGPTDIFLFTWNGHGSRIPDVDGDEAIADPDDIYDEIICPYDIDVVNRTLVNIITDDELGRYFSRIQAKGKCLIFECCLSGGLVDGKPQGAERERTHDSTGLAAPVKTDTFQEMFHPTSLDVNDNATIVIMATLPRTLGLASFLTHTMLLYSLATVITKAHRYDKDNDGVLTVEEAFRSARPQAMIRSASKWIIFWLSVYLTFKYDLYSQFFFLPRLVKIYRLLDWVVPIPVVLATCYLMMVYLFQQNIIHILNGHFFLNWPNMQDDYPGELPLVCLQ